MPQPIDPEQPCFCRIPVKAIPVVTTALRQAGMENEAKQVESFTRYYTDPALNAIRLHWFSEDILRRGVENALRAGETVPADVLSLVGLGGKP